MATECFCGCGREVPFGRMRMTNSAGRQMADDIALFEGALARTPDPEHDDDLRRLVATGIPLRDTVRDLVHGVIDRDQLPRKEVQDWAKEAGKHRKRMAFELIDEDRAGLDALKQSTLLRTGASAPATIVEVADTGTTINDNPRVRLRLRVQPTGAAPFELERKLTVSRLKLPRVGQGVTVYYDLDDPSGFVFREQDESDAASATAPDAVAQIAKLAELHEQGALTDQEFSEAKARLLDDL